MKIKVSAKMLRQKFQKCIPEYITQKCLGRCCQGSGGILVTIHSTEKSKIEAMGVKITKEGFLVADKRNLCPFKNDNGFCNIHGEEQPFGCKASPFTLNEKNTLIVRNRYRLFSCYKGIGALPAFISHFYSLSSILGEKEAQRLVEHCRISDEPIMAEISYEKYRMLKDNDAAKKGLHEKT